MVHRNFYLSNTTDRNIDWSCKDGSRGNKQAKVLINPTKGDQTFKEWIRTCFK